MNKEVALFCTLHPATVEKKQRVLTLLSTARQYYLSPASKCTTWTYFTPIHDAKVTPSLVAQDELDTLVASIEIYTDKSALSTQTESSMFKDYHARITAEQLYSREEELVAWYPTAGFVSRDGGASSFGHGAMVMTPVIVCKHGQRDALVRVLSDYADWVEKNESGFMTYSIMTRPKAPDEVLIFERCAGVEALAAHVQTPQMAESMKLARRYMKSIKGQKWSELDNAFVGSVPGQYASVGTSKL